MIVEAHSQALQVQPLEDRIPIAAEVHAVDPVAAWARMSPEQRDTIGPLLMKWAGLSSPMAYVSHKLPEKGWPASDTPEQIQQRLWSFDDYVVVSDTGDQAYSDLLEAMEKYWPQLYGWKVEA